MKINFVWWWKIIKQYLSNCSIHGVKYLVDDRLSYTERLFWLIFCILSWLGCAIMIMNVVMNYIQYPVALTTETTYVDWQTPFPAIMFCITSNSNIKKYFKRSPGLFINFSTPNFLRASTEDLQSAYDMMRVPCTDLLAECTWNNVKFNCCSEFQELKKTGAGYCIGMNTFHLKKNGKPSVHFFVNRTVKYGDLTIDINFNAKMRRYLFTGLGVYILNNLQLPIFRMIEKDEVRIKSGRTTRVEFTMEDTFNEAGVRKVAIDHRGCRFPNEVRPNNIFDIYSSDACYLELIIEKMIKYCGCVSFYYSVSQRTRVCNGTETLCLIANKSIIMSQSENECLPDCEGTSLIINKLEPAEYESPDDMYARIHFTLLSHPAMRYRRTVVNDKLTVMVSVGSAIGLFVGASILSIFEIPYWLFVRRDKIE